MKWTIENCDILDRPADVLVLSGNIQLNLSGGAGGAFLARYGTEMQQQMHQYLASTGKKYVDHGSVIPMTPCGSPYTAVLHAIGVDAFYDSSPDVITQTVRKSLEIVASHSAKTVALTAIATGFGRLTLSDFADGLAPIMSEEFPPVETVAICLLKSRAVDELAELLPNSTVG